MGQSQSTRSKASSYRRDEIVGQSKVVEAVTSQDTSTTSSIPLDNTPDNGFGMPAAHTLNDYIDETQSIEQVSNVARTNIPTVTITGKNIFC